MQWLSTFFLLAEHFLSRKIFNTYCYLYFNFVVIKINYVETLNVLPPFRKKRIPFFGFFYAENDLILNASIFREIALICLFYLKCLKRSIKVVIYCWSLNSAVFEQIKIYGNPLFFRDGGSNNFKGKYTWHEGKAGFKVPSSFQNQFAVVVFGTWRHVRSILK